MQEAWEYLLDYSIAWKVFRRTTFGIQIFVSLNPSVCQGESYLKISEENKHTQTQTHTDYWHTIALEEWYTNYTIYIQKYILQKESLKCKSKYTSSQTISTKNATRASKLISGKSALPMTFAIKNFWNRQTDIFLL